MYTTLNVTVGNTQWTRGHATSKSINMIQHMFGWLDRNRGYTLSGGATLPQITEVFHNG